MYGNGGSFLFSSNKKFSNDKKYSLVETDTTNVQKLIQFIKISNLNKMIKESKWNNSSIYYKTKK